MKLSKPDPNPSLSLGSHQTRCWANAPACLELPTAVLSLLSLPTWETLSPSKSAFYSCWAQPEERVLREGYSYLLLLRSEPHALAPSPFQSRTCNPILLPIASRAVIADSQHVCGVSMWSRPPLPKILRPILGLFSSPWCYTKFKFARSLSPSLSP